MPKSSSSKKMPAPSAANVKSTSRKRAAGAVVARQRITYSQSFKLRVVRHCLRLPLDARIKPTCRAFPGIEPVQIRKWVRNLAHLAVLTDPLDLVPSLQERNPESRDYDPAAYTDLENVKSNWHSHLDSYPLGVSSEAAPSEAPFEAADVACGVIISRVSSEAASTCTTPLPPLYLQPQALRPIPTSQEPPTASWKLEDLGFSQPTEWIRSLHRQKAEKSAARAVRQGSLRLPRSEGPVLAARCGPSRCVSSRGVPSLHARTGVSSTLNPGSPLVDPSAPIFAPPSCQVHPLATKAQFINDQGLAVPATNLNPFPPWSSRIPTPTPTPTSPAEGSAHDTNEREAAAHGLLSLFQDARS